MESRADQIVETLGLVPLIPEGGFVRQTHLDERSCSIYYLVKSPDFSGLHRLEHLEIWAHHDGAPLTMLLIDPDGVASEPVLGPDLDAGQQPQIVVPGGWWQAAEPLGEWSLVTTFMAPPYTDDCVTFARADDLAGEHPEHADRIRRVCRF